MTSNACAGRFADNCNGLYSIVSGAIRFSSDGLWRYETQQCSGCGHVRVLETAEPVVPTATPHDQPGVLLFLRRCPMLRGKARNALDLRFEPTNAEHSSRLKEALLDVFAWEDALRDFMVDLEGVLSGALSLNHVANRVYPTADSERTAAQKRWGLEHLRKAIGAVPEDVYDADRVPDLERKLSYVTALHAEEQRNHKSAMAAFDTAVNALKAIAAHVGVSDMQAVDDLGDAVCAAAEKLKDDHDALASRMRGIVTLVRGFHEKG